MSLVADYTDSSEAEEGERDDEEQEVTPTSSSNTEHENRMARVINPFGVGGNGQEGEEDSLSSSGSETEEGERPMKRVMVDGVPLDNPFRYVGSGEMDAKDSVFRVDFREEDAQKTALLERHVKMSSALSSSATTIEGKKICWNHRKGKCRFGHKCKYVHDSDTAVIDPESLKKEIPQKDFTRVPSTSEKTSFVANKNKNPFSMDKIDWAKENPVVLSSYPQLSGSGQESTRKKSGGGDSSGDEERQDRKKNKKRPGLTTGLEPSAKVMNTYYKHKHK